jgi:hypothetical protein
MSESPLAAENLLAGTTDGNVWRRNPAGTWVQITGNLPERYVTSVEYSPHPVKQNLRHALRIQGQ